MTRPETDAPDSASPAPLSPGMTAGYVGPKLRLLWNLLSARMMDALEPYGLRLGAFSTMALISANPGCSQIQLARAVGLDKSALVPILDELEARGLAGRTRSLQDRRRHALFLTPQGEALMERMLGPVRQAGQPIRDALSSEEHEQLIVLLERAYAALAAADQEAAEKTAASA